LQFKVHIVDDDAHVRASTSFLLRSLGYSAEVYESGTEFLRDARLETGCILLDLRMPGLSGLDVQQALAERGVTMPLIVLSGHADVSCAVEAMKLGAIDFLEKPYEEQQLVAVIGRAAGIAQTSEAQDARRRAATTQLARLSRREFQILQGLLSGMSNKQIARRLDLSPRTVEMHRARLMAKLGMETLTEAIRFAFDAGLAPLDDAGGGESAN
jgi:two-component system response regulator FixJ